MSPEPLSSVRVDKWLWAVRLYKTRTAAADACRGGHVRVDDQPVKPARDLRAGDVLQVRLADITRTVRVLAPLEHRVGAPLVPTYLQDLTPPEEYERRKRNQEAGGIQRDPGAGRPTKKDRRLLEAFLRIPPPE